MTNDRPIEATTVWELIAARAATTPDMVLLIDENDRTMTCAQYAHAVRQSAETFAARGVAPGTTVAWQLPTWIETIVLLGALARIGARQVPMLPIYREREISFVMTQTNASVLCVPGTWRGVDYGAMAEGVRAAQGGFVVAECAKSSTGQFTLDDFTVPGAARVSPLGDPPPDGEVPRWIYYTSGTTADPKGAQHTDRSSLAAGKAFCERQRVQFGDRFGMAFPFTHVGGLNNLLAGLRQGMGLVMVEAFDPAAASAVFTRNRVTMVGGAPAFYLSFIELQRKNPGESVLPDLRFMTGGGAPMPPEMHLEVKREIGGAGVGHGWGMTESCITAINDPTDTDAHLMFTSGQAVLGMEIKAVLPDGTTAAPGVDGEMRIRGESVMVGYLDDSLNRDAFDDEGWFRTGDIGHLDEDGYVSITGRMKDVIIRKGENISALEIENVLYSHPQVLDVAVVGVPDRTRGELVCAVVECRPGSAPLDFDEMVAHCERANLMRQKIPERLEVVDALPRNATGKVIKHELRSQFAGETNHAP